MDMATHLGRRLNNEALQRMPGRVYEGRIVDVREERVRDRYTGQRVVEPVIEFDDGWLLIPNLGMRRALCEMFGTTETRHWHGAQVRIRLQEREVVNRTTGETRTLAVKVAELMTKPPVVPYTVTPAADGMAIDADDIPWDGRVQ